MCAFLYFHLHYADERPLFVSDLPLSLTEKGLLLPLIIAALSGGEGKFILFVCAFCDIERDCGILDFARCAFPHSKATLITLIFK